MKKLFILLLIFAMGMEGLNSNAQCVVTITATDSTINAGSSTTLTAYGSTSYTWSPAAGLSTTTGSVVIATPSNTTTYTATGNDCSWVSVAAGAYHTLAIKSDGTLWAWGSNFFGQLGDGSNGNKTSPEQIGTDTDWAYVARSLGNFSLAIKTDGTLWGWGSNYNGQLGDGTTMDHLSPEQIGTETDWVRVVAGGIHCIGLKSDGTIWGWGRNYSGQVGDGSFIERDSPVQIGSATNWKSISAGQYHSSGVKLDGTLWGWGENSSGGLGDGTYINRGSPVQAGSATDWASVACGGVHTLGIKTNGSLWGWGGQYLNGDTVIHLSPVQIGTATDWTNIEASWSHSLSIKSDSTSWAFGTNTYGQLGDGSIIDEHLPEQIGAESNWTKLTTGYFHSLGIQSDGTLWAWGDNTNGAIGDGTNVQQNNPEQIPGVGGSGSGTITIYVNPEGVDNLTLENDCIVFPNPTDDLITIKITPPLLGSSYTIFDQMGVVILEGKLVARNTIIDVTGLHAGLYLFKLGEGRNQQLKTIGVQKN